MMIPKNRDNSGTALLYIVGLNFVRPGFVGPTSALSRSANSPVNTFALSAPARGYAPYLDRR